VVGFGQLTVRRDQKPLQALLPGGAVAELADLILDQLRDDRAGQRGDRGARVFEQRPDVPGGQVGDGVEVLRRGGRQERRGGVAVDQLQHPALGDVLG
jgi:hypothetical protein